jgi:hypothetical protein
MASFPAEAIALAKQSVANAELPVEEGLRQEAWLFQRTIRLPEARRWDEVPDLRSAVSASE